MSLTCAIRHFHQRVGLGSCHWIKVMFITQFVISCALQSQLFSQSTNQSIDLQKLISPPVLVKRILNAFHNS
jgi:hypothetical protein